MWLENLRTTSKEVDVWNNKPIPITCY